MKRICALVLLSVIFLTSCSTTFDGYSYNVEDARKKESFYEAYDYIFTVEQDKYVIDFLVYKDYLRILKFDCKERSGNMLYNIRSKSTYLISEYLSHSETVNEDYWIKTGKFLFQVEWLIATENIENLREHYDGFDFNYNDMECVLFYRIVE